MVLNNSKATPLVFLPTNYYANIINYFRLKAKQNFPTLTLNLPKIFIFGVPCLTTLTF